MDFTSGKIVCGVLMFLALCLNSVCVCVFYLFLNRWRSGIRKNPPGAVGPGASAQTVWGTNPRHRLLVARKRTWRRSAKS